MGPPSTAGPIAITSATSGALPAGAKATVAPASKARPAPAAIGVSVTSCFASPGGDRTLAVPLSTVSARLPDSTTTNSASATGWRASAAPGASATRPIATMARSPGNRAGIPPACATAVAPIAGLPGGASGVASAGPHSLRRTERGTGPRGRSRAHSVVARFVGAGPPEDQCVARSEHGHPAGRKGGARRGGGDQGGGSGRDRVMRDGQAPRLDEQDRRAARPVPIDPARRIGQADHLDPLRRRRLHLHVDRQERLDDAEADVLAPVLGDATRSEAEGVDRAPGATHDGGQPAGRRAARSVDLNVGRHAVALGHEVVTDEHERRCGAVQRLQIAHEAGSVAALAWADGVLDEVRGEERVERGGVAGEERAVTARRTDGR